MMAEGAFWSVVFPADHNTRLVVVSTMLLGLASGVVGSFLLLRKRSLMGDALSHATLPGIGLAFGALHLSGFDGKSLGWLLTGALVTGVLGYLTVLLIRRATPTRDDAAMGIVLSVFYGAGAVLMGIVQRLPGGSAAGLEGFIYGKTASLVLSDFWLITGICAVVLIVSTALFKEFRLICFDEGFAASQGWPVSVLDILMLGLVAVVCVVGLQAVGLILIIAFLITPAAAARFWTEDFRVMTTLGACFGMLGGWLGTSLSAIVPRLPAGAVIVLVTSGVFLVSLFFGTRRGVILQLWRRHSLRQRIAAQHLLRAVFELNESQQANGRPVPFQDVLRRRSWSPRELSKTLRNAYREGLVQKFNTETIALTPTGWERAKRVTRNHRLWEVYLIEHADIASTHVDRDADTVEHILGADLVRQLEQHLWEGHHGDLHMPESPHPV